MRPLLLDTCAMIWVAAGEPLGEPAVEALRVEDERGEAVRISPISAWELGLLVARGRLTLTLAPGAWIAQILAQPGVALADMAPQVLIESSFLPGTPPRDPADRIILATARAHGMRIVTRDSSILAYAEAGHAEAIPC